MKKLIHKVLLVTVCCGLAAVSTLSLSNISSSNISLSENTAPTIDSEGVVGSTSKKQLEQQAKQKVKAFTTELKGELVTAIKTKGLSHAVNVCKEKAPEIAQSLSTDGWTVGRTSLKTRNHKNVPDQWETQILQTFDADLKSGTPASSLAASNINEEAFRFMKAIPTGQVCLACHGQQVDPELMKTIQDNYPKDTATRFTLEDIRGAFTLTKELSE